MSRFEIYNPETGTIFAVLSAKDETDALARLTTETVHPSMGEEDFAAAAALKARQLAT